MYAENMKEEGIYSYLNRGTGKTDEVEFQQPTDEIATGFTPVTEGKYIVQYEVRYYRGLDSDSLSQKVPGNMNLKIA